MDERPVRHKLSPTGSREDYRDEKLSQQAPLEGRH
jgi:hypothetical protein